MYRHKFTLFVVVNKNILYCLNVGKNCLQIKPLSNYIKKPDTGIFTSQTGCGKTHLVLELIEKECNKYFDYIVIICPTPRENNKAYHAREWIKNNDKVWLVDPTDNLSELLSELLLFLEVLLIIDDIIANESLDKKGSLYQNYLSQVGIEVIIYGC